MAVHNEMAIIEEKIESLLALDYPKDKIEFFIGSDNSSDGTNELLFAYAGKNPSIHITVYAERQGKPNLINQLVSKAKLTTKDDRIYLLTDASVILETNCLKALVKHFKNEEIFLVDANMKSTGLEKGGVAKSEGTYIKSEVRIKDMESRTWGKMIGPFGGCYTIRSSYYSEVPKNFLVDDFYITMKGYEKGGNAINELSAICYENVGFSSQEEFKRKARISAGNFQNLWNFKSLWFPPFTKLGFAFFSHKILRWLGPFFILFALLSLCWIVANSTTLLYTFLLLGLVSWLFLIPLLNYILQLLNLSLGLFKNITYFNSMNWALLAGFFKYINGINNNVWEPPKRK